MLGFAGVVKPVYESIAWDTLGGGFVAIVSEIATTRIWCGHLVIEYQPIGRLSAVANLNQIASKMLISKEFVFVHVPKTGGTFVKGAICTVRRNLAPFIYRVVAKSIYLLLKKMHKEKTGEDCRTQILNFACPQLPLSGGGGGYHGTCNDIPEKHRHKKILSLVRDPYGFYISCYGTGQKDTNGVWWWLTIFNRRMRTGMSFKDGKEEKNIPDFDRFLHFYSGPFIQEKAAKWMGIQVCSSIGFLTFIYIYSFFNNPAEILTKTDEDLEVYFESGEYRKYMYPVNFLHTKNLSRELYDFFIRSGFDKKHVEFILTAPRANVNRERRQKIASYYNEELINYVKEKDRIYYRYFYKSDA